MMRGWSDGGVSELPGPLVFWTRSYNWIKTKQEEAALTAIAELYCTKWHQSEYGCWGGRGFLSCRWDREDKVCLSTMSYRCLASPWLPVCRTFSLVCVRFNTYVQQCPGNVTRWVKGGVQDLQLRWMICYLYCTCATALQFPVSEENKVCASKNR